MCFKLRLVTISTLIFLSVFIGGIVANLVVKTNRLNQAFQVLTLAELHIIQLAIVDARETKTGLDTNTPLRIDAMRYAEVFGTTRQNAYIRMKEAEETLFNRRFSFYDEDGYLVKSRWVQQVKYLENEGALELVFTLAVVQGISRIDGVKEFFTQYLLSQTANLTSVYSARLYELLIQWKSAGEVPMVELSAFREQLGIDINEYQRMHHFKLRVLDLAINEINEKTDITASYKQHKKGRQIVGFSFSFKQKKTIKKDLSKNLWEAVPVGTRYQNADGDEWVKEENGFLFCEAKKQSMPPALAQTATQNGSLSLMK